MFRHEFASRDAARMRSRMTRTPRRQSRARSPESAPSVHPSAWLRRHRALVMWTLIAAAALCRTVYFVELNATSLIEMQRWAQSDMNYYDRWARALAGGDWLSRTVGPPMHQWHREVADAYLNADPVRAESAKRDAAASGAPDVETFVWMRWTRTPTFYQDPLYPYLAGAVYRTIAEDPRALIL